MNEENEALELLELAHSAVVWADQCSHAIRGAAGGRHYFDRRNAYMRARLAYLTPRAVLTISDIGGCTCDAHDPDPERCVYHAGAVAQPWNHRIPWNCPTYWDGCNCDGGPFYDFPVAAVSLGDGPTEGTPPRESALEDR